MQKLRNSFTGSTKTENNGLRTTLTWSSTDVENCNGLTAWLNVSFCRPNFLVLLDFFDFLEFIDFPDFLHLIDFHFKGEDKLNQHTNLVFKMSTS